MMMGSRLVLGLSFCPPEPGNGLPHVAKQPLLQQQPSLSLITKQDPQVPTGSRRRRSERRGRRGGRRGPQYEGGGGIRSRGWSSGSWARRPNPSSALWTGARNKNNGWVNRSPTGMEWDVGNDGRRRIS
uniref:Uncharacterized protein n=1 Tax=Arundo donax TaxID=35708 RepID=A0A0A9D1V1_ARUDO